MSPDKPNGSLCIKKRALVVSLWRSILEHHPAIPLLDIVVLVRVIPGRKPL